MIDAWTNMSKMSRESMKSAASPRSRSLVSKWVRESCWKSNCYDRWKTTLIRSSTRMLGISLRMTTCTSWGTVIANITTLLLISPTSTITSATWKVPKAFIPMAFSRPKSRGRARTKRLGPRAGGSLNRKGTFLIRLTATSVGNREVPLLISTGRWDL